MINAFPKFLLLPALLLSQVSVASELELTSRFSMYSSLALADEGDLGYVSATDRHLTQDSQTLRMMLYQQIGEHHAWSGHLVSAKNQGSALLIPAMSTGLFRIDSLHVTSIDEDNGSSRSQWLHQPDHLYYQYERTAWRLRMGRQPISWGAGRFWQPADLFGAFSPVALDREYKAGVDGIVLDYYPGQFSSLSVAYLFAEANQDLFTDSWGFYFKQQVGELSELALVGGNVLGTEILGGSFESAIGEIGWRWEGIVYRLENARTKLEQFWVVGLDYQLAGNSFLSLEYYNNSAGAEQSAQLAGVAASAPYLLGLQKHLSRSLLGVSLQHQLSPLLSAGYALLGAYLEQEGRWADSYLHQFNLIYSVSDEADALISVMKGSGEGINNGSPGSEFGALPDTVTMRVQFYF